MLGQICEQTARATFHGANDEAKVVYHFLLSLLTTLHMHRPISGIVLYEVGANGMGFDSHFKTQAPIQLSANGLLE